jgi:hypothetical protein
MSDSYKVRKKYEGKGKVVYYPGSEIASDQLAGDDKLEDLIKARVLYEPKEKPKAGKPGKK